MNPQVKIGVGVDAAGLGVFEGLFRGMMKKLGGEWGRLFGDIGSHLGKAGMAGGLGMAESAAVFGAVGGAAGLIAELGVKTAEYAHHIIDLSEELGISTDSAQRLGFAAELMGKDLDYLVRSIEKTTEAREKALAGSRKERVVQEELHFTDAEMRHMGKEEFWKEVIKRGEMYHVSDTDLDVFLGKQGARQGRTAAKAMEYAEQYITPIDKETLNMLSDEWRAWKTILKELGVILAYVGALLVMVVRVLRIGLVDAMGVLMSAIAKVIAVILKGLSYIPGFGGLKAYAKSANEVSGYLMPDFQEEAKRLVGKGKEFGKEKDTTDIEPAESIKHHLGNLESNPFLKIGGLAGVDTNFRIERLMTDIERHTRKTAENTTPKSIPVTGVDAPKQPTLIAYDGELHYNNNNFTY